MSNSNLTNEEKLDRIYEISLKNHDVLEGMRERERIANSVRILYWIVVIAALGGTYFYVKPTIDAISAKKESLEGALSQFEQLRESMPQNKVLADIMHALYPNETNATGTPNGQ
jgi:hypothetical protein